VIAKRAFRALPHRNFRPFCVGQGGSLVSTWGTAVAGTPVLVLPTGGK